MFKKITLAIVLCGAVQVNQAGPIKMVQKTFDWGVRQLRGYREISPKYYPKAVAYLDALKTKYPEALEDVDFFIGVDSVTGGFACSIMSTIFISEKYIKKIEADDQNIKKAFEFILLHEAGHIRHYHAMKTLALLGVCSLAIWCYLSAETKFDENTSDEDEIRNFKDLKKEIEKIKKVENAKKMQDVSTFHKAIATSAVTVMFKLLSRFGEEPQADDYACEQCENPEAMQAVATFMDRHFSRGWFVRITHPSVQSRIEKIKEAYKNKFGQEMPE